MPPLRKLQLLTESLPERGLSVLSILRSRQQVVDLLRPFRRRRHRPRAQLTLRRRLPVLSIRDPVHGFVRADPLETALINSRPVQRLRFIHQLGFTFLVFPGAEHSRFGHVIGAMHLAGRVYDALCSKSGGMLPGGAAAPERRLTRAAALLHDLGHAPFSHSAEDLFEGGIDHEEMTRRLLGSPEIEEIFARHGEGLGTADVRRLLAGGRHARPSGCCAKIVSGELDVDKMDYLLRDSLFCGVRYGTYDLERLLDTMLPIEDPETGEWGIGVEEGGVHALEALVMARYYMFTQVYFNVTGKALELHLNEWLEERGMPLARGRRRRSWPRTTSRVWSALRTSASVHARAAGRAPALPRRLRDPRAPAAARRRSASRRCSPQLRAPLRRRQPAGLQLRQGPPPPGQQPRPGAPLRRLARADGAGQPVHPPPVAHRPLPRLHPAPLRDEVAAALRGGVAGGRLKNL